jgi:hypothetical protein
MLPRAVGSALVLGFLGFGCQSSGSGGSGYEGGVPALPPGTPKPGLSQQQFTKTGTGESFFTLFFDCEKGMAYEDRTKRSPAPQITSFEPQVQVTKTKAACPQMPGKPTYRYQFFVLLKYSVRSDAVRGQSIPPPGTEHVGKYDCNCIDGEP